MINNISQILDFMVEIEKLKDVHRKTRPVGLGRFENSAEHSWHVCLSALMLKDYANEEVDIDRVIKMLLIHDLGEIDAGDTIFYSSEREAVKDDEKQGVKRLFDMLPQGESEKYMELWLEFEAGETADSKFAKAIDRVPPLLHNIHGDGHSWKKNNVPQEKVFAFNKQHIDKGSKELWSVIEDKLNKAVVEGILK